MNPERQIGICGTFDVANYGDLLFPLLAEAELQQRLGPVKLHAFSYRQKAPPAWPYPVTPLADLPAAAGRLDGMVIGGGDVVRFDKAIAPDYFPPTPDIHHPTGYWLTPMLIAAQAGCPVVWNAPGVHGDIPAWAGPLLELAIAVSSEVAVRDAASRQALIRFAGDKQIQIVPDTAFGVARLVNVDKPTAEFTELCKSIGVKSPYLIVQATPGLEAFTSLVRRQPHLFREYQLVLLPVCPIHGDDAACLGDLLPGGIRLPAWPHPLLLAELIGHAGGTVGTSLHLTITALAFGVPVFRPGKTLSGKFAQLAGFDTVATFDDTAEIDPIWFAARLGRTLPSPPAQAAVRRLSRHWDDLAARFRTDAPKPARLETLGRFWQTLPRRLETEAVRLATVQDEHEVIRAERDSLTSERDGLIAERNAIYQSNFWKLTKPLWFLSRTLRRQARRRRTSHV